MRITVEKAREFFTHPSQQLYGVMPDNLPDEGFEYWADGPVCGVAHQAPYPGVWMVHIACKPEGRGNAEKHTRNLLNEFWNDKKPDRLIGWTPARFRHAVALNRRLGFKEDGRLPMPDGDVIMFGWRP